MDALSEALNAVRMTGAIFFNAEFSAPWGFESRRMRRHAHILAPGTERLVRYHLVTEGEALFRIGRRVTSCPAGDDRDLSAWRPAHGVQGSPTTLFDSAVARQFLSGKLARCAYGGGGEATRFVCGYFGCERHADRLFLAGLPPMIRINVRGDAAATGSRARSDIWFPSGAPDVPDTRSCSRRWRKRSSSKPCAAIWSNCRPNRPAGSRRARPRSSAPRSPPSQALPSLDRGELAARSARRAPCWRSGSRGFLASRR